jgi:hypothetical protein
VALGDVRSDATAIITPLQTATRTDVTAIPGTWDFGSGPWPGERRAFTKVIARWRTRLGLWLFVMPGNYENCGRVDPSPPDTSGAISLGPQLRALPQGHPINLGECSVGPLGGAPNVGPHRQPPRSSWQQQRITPEDIAALNSEPHYILTCNEVPASVPVESQLAVSPKTAASAYQRRKLLEQAVAATRLQLVLPRRWRQRATHARIWNDGTTTQREFLLDEDLRNNCFSLDLPALEQHPVDLRQWSVDPQRIERERAPAEVR